MVLVIGYGNELRRDDGVGPHVARIVEAWRLPGVAAVAVHQLTPELGAGMAGAGEVLFVDAGVDAIGLRVLPVHPEIRPAVLGHVGSPAGLLALTAALYDRQPMAWLIRVPVADSDFGENLSATAVCGADAALRYLRRRLLCSPQAASNSP
jgi:hydrogenase maturation protease